MRKTRIIALAVLIVGNSLALALSQQPEVERSDRGTAPTAGSAQGARFRETVTVAADEPIPNLPGKRLVTHVVDYPLGGGSASHRHARSACADTIALPRAARNTVRRIRPCMTASMRVSRARTC